jgi:hypothetical protein
MRRRVLVAASLLLAVMTTGTSANGITGRRQWDITYLKEPTLIGAIIVQGPVLFVHDEEKMARGGPCTSVFLFDPHKGPGEEIATFHCIPKARNVAKQFTIRTKPNTELRYGCILTEYQFAGDAEGHGVPLSTNAH